MKILNLFFPSKKTVLKVPKPYTKRINYSCENKSLEFIIKAYLNGTKTTEECLRGFIEIMAYNDKRHLKENAEIFPLLEDFLKDATWKKERTDSCGDYLPERPEPWLRCIYSIYDSIIEDIDCSENLLNMWHKKITTEEFMKVNTYKIITPEIYEKKDQLKSIRDRIKSIIEKNNYTPLEILLLIKENWAVLYDCKAGYEAIEYCVAASENHTEPKYFNSAFRDYGRKMGKIYQQACSK